MSAFFKSLKLAARKPAESSDSEDETPASTGDDLFVDYSCDNINKTEIAFPVKSETDDAIFDQEDTEVGEQPWVLVGKPEKSSVKRVRIPVGISDDADVKSLLAKAAVKSDFDLKPSGDILRKSKRATKKERRDARLATAGDAWFNMRAPELTDETRMDLELLQMRNALSKDTFYRKPDRAAPPRYFQVGKIVETKADFYSSRLTNKQRKRTLVDEMLSDYQGLEANKRRFDKIRGSKARVKKGKNPFAAGHVSKTTRRVERGTIRKK